MFFLLLADELFFKGTETQDRIRMFAIMFSFVLLLLGSVLFFWMLRRSRKRREEALKSAEHRFKKFQQEHDIKPKSDDATLRDLGMESFEEKVARARERVERNVKAKNAPSKIPPGSLIPEARFFEETKTASSRGSKLKVEPRDTLASTSLQKECIQVENSNSAVPSSGVIKEDDKSGTDVTTEKPNTVKGRRFVGKPGGQGRR